MSNSSIQEQSRSEPRKKFVCDGLQMSSVELQGELRSPLLAEVSTQDSIGHQEFDRSAIILSYDEESRVNSVDGKAYDRLDAWAQQSPDNEEFIQAEKRNGTISGSTFVLISCTMGAGTITMPYIIAQLGVCFGALLLVGGAYLSYYSSMCLVWCAQLTHRYSYEDFAELAFGRKWRLVTSISICISLLGFVTVYITLFKTLMPAIMEQAFGAETLPFWLQKTEAGKAVYATIFSFLFLLPLGLFQNLSKLAFTAAFGFLCSMTLMIILTIQLFANKDLVPDASENFESADLMIVNMPAIVETVPFICFLYMYQPNLPQVYEELRVRSEHNIKRILLQVSFAAIIVYSATGIFGYTIFVDDVQSQLLDASKSKNILEADFQGAKSIQFARVLVVACIVVSAPLALLPAKYAFKECFFKAPQMSTCQNCSVSVIMIVLCYLLAVLVPNIGTVISVAGATVNPFIGFIFPIVFYLKLDPGTLYSLNKLLAMFILVLISVISILGFRQLFI